MNVLKPLFITIAFFIISFFIMWIMDTTELGALIMFVLIFLFVFLIVYVLINEYKG